MQTFCVPVADKNCPGHPTHCKLERFICSIQHCYLPSIAASTAVLISRAAADAFSWPKMADTTATP